MRTRRVIATVAALLASGTAFAGTPAWTISESSGSVTVVTRGISKIAARGGSLSAGDLVSTSTNGRAVLVRGQEYLVVSPGSRIRIADPVASGGFTQIIQDFGNAVFRIKKKSSPHFAVETPYLAAVVKGTTFSVTVTDTGTAVQVTEGLVQVSTTDGGASHLVRPGDIGLVESANPFRLSIKGRDAQVIESPNPPAAKAAPAATIAAAATQAFAEVEPGSGDPNAAEARATANATPMAEMPILVEASASSEKASMFDTVIGAPVTEGMVNLDTMSGGMVQGNSMLMAVEPALVEANVPQPAPVEVAVALPVANSEDTAVDVSATVIAEASAPTVTPAAAVEVASAVPVSVAVAEVAPEALPPVVAPPEVVTVSVSQIETPEDSPTPQPLVTVAVVSSDVREAAMTTGVVAGNGNTSNGIGNGVIGSTVSNDPASGTLGSGNGNSVASTTTTGIAPGNGNTSNGMGNGVIGSTGSVDPASGNSGSGNGNSVASTTTTGIAPGNGNTNNGIGNGVSGSTGSVDPASGNGNSVASTTTTGIAPGNGNTNNGIGNGVSGSTGSVDPASGNSGNGNGNSVATTTTTGIAPGNGNTNNGIGNGVQPKLNLPSIITQIVDVVQTVIAKNANSGNGNANGQNGNANSGNGNANGQNGNAPIIVP